ncbi:hypothetical protein ACH5RR_001482 [Cinchona calisaya]|uniref:Uncharacterized protein n=1 Tax=Cinchona calisaya TaxID=153742 RepID=A0ABD3B458_9GENT
MWENDTGFSVKRAMESIECPVNSQILEWDFPRWNSFLANDSVLNKSPRYQHDEMEKLIDLPLDNLFGIKAYPFQSEIESDINSWGHEHIAMKLDDNALLLTQQLAKAQVKLYFEVACFKGIIRELELKVKDLKGLAICADQATLYPNVDVTQITVTEKRLGQGRSHPVDRTSSTSQGGKQLESGASTDQG